MKFLAMLEKQRQTWFLIIISFTFFLLRLPSLFEPYWYGDEGIYEVIGKALRNGRSLYTGIFDNKPPLLYYIYAIFSGNQFGVKALSLVVGLGAIICFFFLANKFFNKDNKNLRAIYVATILFTFLFGSSYLEGNIANAENFMLLPIIAAAFIMLKITTTNTNHPKPPKTLDYKFLFITGILLGLAFLIKIVAIFDFAAFAVFISIEGYRNLKTIKTLFFEIILFGIGFAFPILCTIALLFIHGNLSAFIEAAFSNNVGYVGYGNALIIPQGLLILKLVSLGLVVLLIFFKRKKIPTANIFIFLWLSFSVFDMLFSGRPYTHYVLMTIAPFSLLAGLIYFDHANKKLLIIILLAFVIFTGWNFSLLSNLYKRTFGYYVNFLSFVGGAESVTDYYKFFDRISPRDYALSQFVNMNKNPKDMVFVWGNSAQIYMLTNTLPPGRFTVAYHMTFSKNAYWETRKSLIDTAPKFVLVLPNQPPLPYSLNNYKEVYSYDNATVYEKIL